VFHGSANSAHYVTSKAGVIGFTRSLARELGDHNINVNAIAPGLTLSLEEMTEDRLQMSRNRAQARSIKRDQEPEDLVGTAVFLCSPDSDFITGQTIVVDGGAQMH
jgi:3-oxoacyl-[acyl-carrier protein] reductase